MNTDRIIKRHESDLRKLAETGLTEILGTPAGRYFLWQLLGEAGITSSPFAGDSAAQTNFNCGAQSLGFYLLEQIAEASPHAYLQMQQESYEHAQALAAKLINAEKEHNDET